MQPKCTIDLTNALSELCAYVRATVEEGDITACFEPVCQAMTCYPHAPQPHNLLGILLEKSGDHVSAMKHFRAALALDPTYLPANINLQTYGTFFSRGSCAYDENDLPPAPKNTIHIEYDERGIGYAVRR